jgi:hypothetical protein
MIIISDARQDDRIQRAFDVLHSNGVRVLLSISVEDIYEVAAEQETTVTPERALAIVDMIYKEHMSGDDWQAITDRVGEMLAD